jgi:tripartite-type tricarboxylate transporter receptor subunit TctC
MAKFFALLMFVTLLPVGAAAQNAAWKSSWEETLAAAREEGKVVISGPPVPELRQALPAAFAARYGIAVEYIAARGGTEAAARMRAERQRAFITSMLSLPAFRAWPWSSIARRCCNR